MRSASRASRARAVSSVSRCRCAWRRASGARRSRPADPGAARGPGGERLAGIADARRGAAVHEARTSRGAERLLALGPALRRAAARFADARERRARAPRADSSALGARQRAASCCCRWNTAPATLRAASGREQSACTSPRAGRTWCARCARARRRRRIRTRSTAPSFEGRRILLAEDAPENRIIVLAHLRKAGCSIEVAVDGEQAVETHRLGQFDLVLMDVHMPRVDGCEATRRIRARSAKPGVADRRSSRSPRTPTRAEGRMRGGGLRRHLGSRSHAATADSRAAAVPAPSGDVARARAGGERRRCGAQIPPDVADLAEEYLGNRRADAEALQASRRTRRFRRVPAPRPQHEGLGSRLRLPPGHASSARGSSGRRSQGRRRDRALAGALSEYAERMRSADPLLLSRTSAGSLDSCGAARRGRDSRAAHRLDQLAQRSQLAAQITQWVSIVRSVIVQSPTSTRASCGAREYATRAFRPERRAGAARGP